MNRRFLIIAFFIIVAGGFGYWQWEKNNISSLGGKEKIGVILPLTGDAASYGKSLQEGIITADSLLRDSLSFDLQIIYEDSKAEWEPKRASFADGMFGVACDVGGECTR